MTDKHHPGDWLWIMAGERMVAMTPEAYEQAVCFADGEVPDAWEDLRSRGGTRGQLIKVALDVLVDSGRVRVETREVVGCDGRTLPVYAVVPPQAEAPPRQRRAKRERAKRPLRDGAPSLGLVPGRAAE